MPRIYTKEFELNVSCIVSSNLIINAESVDLYFNAEVKFDTGADITLFPASELGLGGVAEEDFTHYLQTKNNVGTIQRGILKPNTLIATTVIGINTDAESIKAYLLQVDSFCIKTSTYPLKFGSVPIFVSFDPSFVRPILGKDILSLISYSVDNDIPALDIDFTSKFKTYISSHGRIDALYYSKQGFYNSSFLVHTYKQV